ncbi:MAG: DUF3572 domain-containing protein [Dinoroseobacter sp.]|nr:DUF3572 domain-containing protein [Dinoroseobacter sp.]
MQQDFAEEIALKALAWIASDEQLLQVFLGASGASGSELKSRIADPEFLLSVLDFLTMDDAWIVGFCDTEGLAYDLPMQAKGAFPGGAQVSWT